MKKENVILIIVLLVTSAIVLNMNLSSAQPASPSSSKTLCDKIDNTWFKEKCAFWIKGMDINTISSGEINAIGEAIKWFSLVLAILLIYSAFSYVNFPENIFLRILISVPTAFIATFFITTPQLITIMQSYTAMGITLSIIIPILALGFITFAVAVRGSALGLYFQRLLWTLFSIFLFFSTYTLWRIKSAISAGTLTAPTDTFPLLLGIINLKVSQETINTVQAYDAAILITLLVTSISVFLIMVIFNQKLIALLLKGNADAHVEASKIQMKRSKEYERQNAEAMGRY